MGFWIKGLGFRVQGFGFRFSGFEVSGFEFQVACFGSQLALQRSPDYLFLGLGLELPRFVAGRPPLESPRGPIDLTSSLEPHPFLKSPPPGFGVCGLGFGFGDLGFGVEG